MNGIQLCVFDFDGTLGDTANVILNTLRATFAEMGLPPKAEGDCRSVIGLPLERCFSTLFPLDETRAEECAATYRRLFPTFDTDDAVTLFPHVRATLESLKNRGVLVALASSRGHESLASYVRRLGLTGWVDYVVGADDVAHAKPHPEPVRKILEVFGIKPAECLVVGDAPYDILMGRNAGCLTCAVTYGNGTREELKAAGADRLVDDFGEILSML